MIKRLFSLMILIVLEGPVLFGQPEINNFKIEENDLIWQKIFQSDTSMKVIDLFVSAGIIDNIIVKDNQIMGDLKPFDADFKGAGYSEMNTPIYVARMRIKGYITVDIKVDRYRVTIKDIRLKQIYDDGLSKQGEETSLSSFALKGTTDFKPAFLKAPVKIYNYSFENRIKLKMTTDNW